MKAPAMHVRTNIDNRDVDAFSEFYERSYAVLVGHVFVVTTDRAEAEEAVQEAFARLWSRWPQISGYENPEAWVRRVALNIARKRWRRARRGLQLMQDAYEPADAEIRAAANGERLDLIEGLQRLPAAHREALLLHYVVGLSVREVADEMSTRLVPIRPGTVKSWLHRGRAELGRALSSERTSGKEDEDV
jgi:RNA polymerase sigma-70 factor, ECF subfamily